MKQRTQFPRTQEQAFGPYHRGPIFSEPEPMHLHDKIVLVGVVLVALGCVVAYVYLTLRGGAP